MEKERIEVVSERASTRRKIGAFLRNSIPGNIFVDENCDLEIKFLDRQDCDSIDYGFEDACVICDYVQLIVRVRDGYLITTNDFFLKDGFLGKEHGYGVLVAELKLGCPIQVVDYYDIDETMRELAKADYDDSYVSSRFKLLEYRGGLIDDSVELDSFLHETSETIRIYSYYNDIYRLVVKNPDGEWVRFGVMGIIKGTKKKILAVLDRHTPIVLDAEKLELPTFDFED